MMSRKCSIPHHNRKTAIPYTSLILLVIIGSLCHLFRPYNHHSCIDVVVYVDGWKIRNLFQRHTSTSDDNNNNRNDDDHDNIHNTGSSFMNGHINSHVHTGSNDNSNVDDDTIVVAAPSIAPTITSSEPTNTPDIDYSWVLNSESPQQRRQQSFDENLLSLLRQSFQIPSSLCHSIHRYFDVCKEQIRSVVCHRPPVGIVSIIVVIRFLVRLQRILNHYINGGSNDPSTNVEDQLFLQKLRQRDKRYHYRNQRSYLFNQDDMAYHTFGGIERIRTRLCLASLRHSIAKESKNGNSISSLQQNSTSKPSDQQHDDNPVLQQLLIQALSVSSSPKSGSAWIQYIYDMIIPLAQVEERYNNGEEQQLKEDSTSTVDVDNSIIAISTMTGKARLYDSLLRLCRDRVLQTTYRLARTVEHWERRMRYNTRRGSSGQKTTSINTVGTWLVHKLFRIHSIEDDRLCLSLAKVAYTMEVTRLGEITALLMERPLEMEPSNLIYALKSTEQRRHQAKETAPMLSISTPTVTTGEKNDILNTSGEELKASHGLFTKFTTIVPSTMRKLSNYSFRWKADGKGFLSIRKFDNKSDGYIDGESANTILLHRQTASVSNQRSRNEPSNYNNAPSLSVHSDVWMSQANAWVHRVKSLICQVIRESLQASASKSLPKDCSEDDFDTLQEQWHRNDDYARVKLNTDINTNAVQGGIVRNREQQYRTIVNYIDSSTTWRRIGEGEKIRLRDVFGMNDWIARLDLLGIPSSILLIYLAYNIHSRVIVPYWSTIRQSSIEIFHKASEILEQRVWVPLKGIYDDIMNRSPSMMSALGLDVEETSLDRMLQDLNFGDGTPATRQEAIRKATEQYEHDLSHGLFANFARGRLVRLLLIQVQQLKVGMLSALETIDVLIVGNRIHFKVLAAIPAIFIASYGTRYFFRGLYNIRAKDIRPISAVHNEMTQYLNKIEKILLLADPIRNINRNSSEHGKETKSIEERQGNRQSMENTPTRVSASTSKLSTVRHRDETTSNNSHRRTVNFSPLELGEMILNTHRYLVLLDFSSPQPFPIYQCDEIHTSLQQYFDVVPHDTRDDDTCQSTGNGMIHHLDPTRQVQWLNTIQQKHQELMKFL